ncbi:MULTISPECIES: class II aldolase/adducin family protein [Nocardiopsis]|uniref:Class II aldolase/adducin family protein n=1 Tax=Nocardiopsis dassonvillei (strain ATCC 23218 / DSM 43111 / CIP 107115 / JCM 7437 / KCTC 9190 / NBRC 14626 / NCTC 10488 / NRRL B-5397 / IMRU 509) TaxID=446468 RepID=D7AVR4_NOCDD|nr:MULTISPECIES: class II aldolase/adducin family protein [Nocardiopsis]ADH67753.1 class II aldolase/adducin family protein [Nocardiopsis dassonvillei subsp. dassonvillei DSM 43111]APC35922.1 aldolase [Nocardiopsis dassonvillei]NKY81282.1 aldolase [Nocardiopsis dassonvillei]VEI88207.1 L-fuculose phosphate aldolase [Nocardiopsis dassonvillei]
MNREAREAARELCAVGRRAVELGLSPGASGNVSARAGGLTLMSPTGVSLRDLDPEGLSVLDGAGEHVAGPPPSKEFPLHQAMYRRVPDAGAVVHLHSPHACAASCLPAWSEASALPPVTPYLVMRVGQAPLVPYAAPGSDRLADNLSRLPGRFRAALLANHGSIVAASGPAAALDGAVELEEASRIVVSLRGSEFSVLSPEDVRELTGRYGTDWDL